MDRPSRVKEILTELHNLWGQRRVIDEREAELECELASSPAMLPREETKPPPVVALRGYRKPPSDEPPAQANKAQRKEILKRAAEKRGLIGESAPARAKVSGSHSNKTVEVPRWLKTKLLDIINAHPGRRFRAGEMAEELDAVVHVSAVTTCLVSLAEEGFIKRLRRYGPFWAQDNPEPQMGPTVELDDEGWPKPPPSEDALDQERAPIEDVTVAPTQAELGELEALS